MVSISIEYTQGCYVTQSVNITQEQLDLIRAGTPMEQVAPNLTPDEKRALRGEYRSSFRSIFCGEDGTYYGDVTDRPLY